jgi:hypothetical protein
MWNQRLCIHAISKFLNNLRLHRDKHVQHNINEHDPVNFHFQLNDNNDGYDNFNLLELHEYDLDYAYNYERQYNLHQYAK